MQRYLRINAGFAAFVLTVLTACGNDPSGEQGRAIARVGEEYLYEGDLRGLVQSAAAQEDSAGLVERYVDLWIKRKLLLEKARQEIDIDEAELARRVEEYKFQLVIYDYERSYIERNLDTAVSREDIYNYYEANKDNFVLKNSIIKGIYLKVPKEAPRVRELKGIFRDWDDKNKKEVKEYALQFAADIHLADSVWMPLADITSGTPFRELVDANPYLLRKGSLLSEQDTAFYFYLKINDYKLSDEISPIGFVDEQIRDIILNRRKLELKRTNEQRILDEAKKKKQYEIFE